MKKILYILSILPLLFLGGCVAPEEIVFDHEKPAFDTKDGKILLEVIVPSDTKADDQIYIAGPFNGGDEIAAEDSKWYLEHSTTISQKWGIYLDPSDFVSGKSLADGFHFVSVSDREERTALNGDMKHTDNPSTGSRTNIFVTKWASFFDKPEGDEVIEHNGFVVFLKDNQGWDETALYIWGTSEIFGGWPGSLPTGTQTINGERYKYWDLGEANTGNDCNFIFNNNGGGEQIENFDCLKGQKANKNYYFVIEDDEATVIGGMEKHHIYVINESEWTDVAMYFWGDVNDLGAGWPGNLPSGTTTVAGKTALVFDYGDDWFGLAENMILNNTNGEQTADIAITLADEDVYVLLKSKSDAKIVTLEELQGGTPGTDPEPEEPGDPVEVKVYVEDLSGWDELYLYVWGDNVEPFGGWPGKQGEKVTAADGTVYNVFTVAEEFYGKTANLIFHNNKGEQFDALTTKWSKDIRLTIKNGLHAVEGELPELVAKKAVKIYVDDQTGWDELHLYSWGGTPNVEPFGGWSGATPETLRLGGKSWKVFTVAEEFFGTEYNMIFNNNNGTQFDGPKGTWTADMFLKVTAEGAEVAETPDIRIYVDNQTGWEATALYTWGDSEIFGGWPGVAVTGEYVSVSLEHFGKTQNLIFNNNGAGSQLENFDCLKNVVLNKDYKYVITADGATLSE